MPESVMFHDGNRQLQDQFDSRRISDRLEEKLTRKEFLRRTTSSSSRALPYFFSATADAGGTAGLFVQGRPARLRARGPGLSEIAFPDYDGNGMFKSLGNVTVNPSIGLLFIAMHDRPQRLRVNGEARVSDDDPLLGEIVGAQLIVRVAARAIFPNCPRYIPEDADDGSVGLHAGSRMRGAGTQVEGVFRLQGCHPSAPPDLQGVSRATMKMAGTSPAIFVEQIFPA